MRSIAALGLERVFSAIYAKQLAPARAATIRARCQLGIAVGILFSAVIMLQVPPRAELRAQSPEVRAESC